MTVTTKRWTLADYLTYDDGSDSHCYELENGEIIKMSSESDSNLLIAMYLLFAFGQFVSPKLLRTKTEIQTSGSRATVRIPDLMVLTEELAEALRGASRSLVYADMPSPQLVVEVVSPGKKGRDRDYRYKRSEYAARNIPEYWIVDPIVKQVLVLRLVEGLYEDVTFINDQLIQSDIFPQLSLTAAQVLQSGEATAE